MKTFYRLAIAIVVFSSCWCVGCSGGSISTLKGKVLLDGKPVNKAQVQLLPKGNAVGGMHSATTDEEGNFTIVEAANSNNPIKPGDYVVLVNKLSGGMGEMVNELPNIYQDRNTTPLTIEIQSAETQLSPFELASKSVKSPVDGETK